MLLSYNSVFEQLGWEKNATQHLTTSLHPLDEQISLTLFKTFAPFIVAIIIANFILLCNLKIAIRMVKDRPRFFSSWCCLIPSSLGVLLNVIFMFMILIQNLNCQLITWMMSLSMSICMACNSALLLQKAYLALCKKQWVLYVGVPLILLQLAYFGLLMRYCSVWLRPDYGCIVYQPYFILIYWLIVNILPITLFSCIFCYVAYNQYCKFGTRVWKQLGRDGLQTMFFVIIFEISCCVIVSFNAFESLSPALFYINWIIITTLNTHCKTMRKAFRISGHAKEQLLRSF
ncbi:hypothetical protein BDF19DRAFT_454017 [Syncephalis fuscata]|nr:hypothetical protein BDF19DRAFT_454017 [Syncephalis fuscata]